MKIETVFVNPPIGDRSCDWEAMRDDYEPGAPIGRGRTEEEAIQDLMWQIESACPTCGAQDYSTYKVSPSVGDPSHKYCVCSRCQTQFKPFE